MITDQNIERRFLLLKKRLDALHYCQPLTIESSPLVEKILNDLVKTTEGFQQQKKQLEEVKIQGVKNEQLLAPLKKENGRLIVENNSLHMAMIQVKEECEFRDNKFRAQVKMLESERNDWKFMVTQKTTQEKKLQEEMIQLKQRLEFSERKSKGIENHDQNSDFEMKALKEEQRKWLDRIQEAQQSAQDAKEQQRTIELGSFLLEEKVKHCELQVDNREKEITRLKSKLDLGSVNLEKLSNDYQLQEQIQKCQRLSTQIDLMTQENTRLSDEVQENKKRQQAYSKSSPNKKENKQGSGQKQEKAAKMQHQREIDERESIIELLKSSLEEVKRINVQLEHQVESMMEQNEQLAGKAQRAENLIQAYQSDKLAFNRGMDTMKSQKDNIEGMVDDYKSQISDLRDRIREYEEKNNNLIVQSQQFQREKEIIERQQSRVVDENEKLQDSISKIREQLRKQERENDVHGGQVRELRSEVERLETLRSIQDEQLSRLKSDQFLVKSDADSSQLTRQKVDQQNEALRRENELLHGSMKTVEGLLQQSKRDIQLLDGELQEIKHERRIMQDKSGQLSQQNAKYQTLLELKTQECVKLDYQCIENQKVLARNRLDATQSDDQNQRLVQEHSNRIKEQETKTVYLQQESQLMRFEKIERDEKIKQYEDRCHRLTQDNDKLQFKMAEYSDHSTSVQMQMKRAGDRENEYTILVSELERVRDSERKLIVERERLTSDMKKMDITHQNQTKQVDQMVRQKEEMLKEIRDLRSDLSKTKYQDHDTKNVSIQLNERLNSQESAMQDMRELLQREQKRSSKATQDLSEQRQEYLQAHSKCEDLEAQLKQLRTLSESLERSREELLTRLQGKNSDKLDEEKLLSVSRSQNKQIGDLLKTCEQELLATKQALEQVDHERDEMQSALDDKTEKNVQLQQRMQRLEEELDRQQSKMVEVQSRGERGFETVGALEEKLRDNQFRSQKMANEIENLRYTVSVKDKELGELTQDVQILSRETQQLNNQLSRFGQDKDQHLQQQSFTQLQEVKAREQLRLSEMEMRDMQANYVEVCADNQRLQTTIQQLSYQHQEMLGRLQEQEKEDDFLAQQMQAAQRKEEQLTNQLTQLDRELQVTSRRCEEQERQLRDAQKNQEQLHKDYNAQRRVSQGFQNNQDEQTRQLASQDNERRLLQDQVTAYRREIDVKDNHLDIERHRAHDIEKVLMYERENQMRTVDEIQALRNQNETLSVEMEKMQLRFPQQRQDFGGISRVSGESPYVEPQDNNRQLQDRSHDEQNSRLDQSAGWDKLRMESENFKKSLTQAAISSQYLKMKMKGLAREYEVVLPPQRYNN